MPKVPTQLTAAALLAGCAVAPAPRAEMPALFCFRRRSGSHRNSGEPNAGSA